MGRLNPLPVFLETTNGPFGLKEFTPFPDHCSRASIKQFVGYFFLVLSAYRFVFFGGRIGYKGAPNDRPVGRVRISQRTCAKPSLNSEGGAGPLRPPSCGTCTDLAIDGRNLLTWNLSSSSVVSPTAGPAVPPHAQKNRSVCGLAPLREHFRVTGLISRAAPRSTSVISETHLSSLCPILPY